METYIQVVTTAEKRQDAEKIAKALVERRLAACVQLVGPIVSTYWWKNNIETAEEWQCLIKSKKGFYDEVEKVIKMLHPYETPEIIALPIVSGSDDYLEWLDSELKSIDRDK
jgi:periplasmic divalent cation tolerance protein